MKVLLLIFSLFSCSFSLPFSSSSSSSSSSTYSLSVNSTLLWNPLKIITFQIGTKLLFSSNPKEYWYDLNHTIETTANGYKNIANVTMRYNITNDNIMSMICCMNNLFNNCENVGIKGELLVKEEGFISCFANDNPYTYGNNDGSIVTVITVGN